ncbi:MAG: hypothetical protein WDM85_16385 [Caulobacteraceae bacterium]
MDPHWLFFILVFATVFSFGQPCGAWSASARPAWRSTSGWRRPSGPARSGDLVLELRKQRGFGKDGRSIISWAWLGDLVLRSGVTVDVRRWVLTIVGGALGVAAVAY